MNTQRNLNPNASIDARKSIAQSGEITEFFTIALDPLCVIGTDGYFQKVNPAMISLLEYTEEELLFRPYLAWVHPEDVAATRKKYNQLKESSEIHSFENRFRKKTGEYCWLLWSFRLSGETGMIYAVARDNTVQRMMENALFESERRYKSIFNHTPVPLWIYHTENLRFLNVNQTAIDHYGYSIGEFLQMSVTNLYPPTDRRKLPEMVKTFISQQKPQIYFATHLKKNGEVIQVEVTSTNIVYQSQPARMVIINDITEKARLQEQLKKEELTRERQIAQATIAAQEKEREFLGKELHDNINQILTSTKLYLDMAEEAPSQKCLFIRKSKENIIHAINEIRALSKSLIPSSLKDLSFTDAIEELLEPYWQRNFFAIQLDHEGPLNMLSDDLKLALFRVLQEQLTNITRHAKAKKVWISIRYKESIHLIIEDDGQGFDTHARREGIGINNIRNRIRVFNGHVEIISAPGQGCLLKAVIPVEEERGS